MFVVKIPGVNGFGKTKGCKNSGGAILKELKNINVNEQGKIVDVKLLDLEEIHLDDSNLKYSNDLIYKNSFEIFEKKPKTVFLGGDHFISYSVGNAFLNYCNKNEKSYCLIVFDSRPNCKESEDSGFPTHEGWLKALVEEGFSSEKIFLVGIRNFCLEEINFLKNLKIKFISMNSLLDDLQEICDMIMEFSNKKDLYV